MNEIEKEKTDEIKDVKIEEIKKEKKQNVKIEENKGEQKRYKIVRTVILIIVLMVLVYAGSKCLPIVQSMSSAEGREAFKVKVTDMGIKGPFYVLLIQILQMIVAVIPGEPVEMTASMCFGFFGGLALCLTGFFIGSCIIFILVRKIGVGFMQLFFSKEKIDKIKNKSFFSDASKFEAALFIIFIIPGIPKDIFLYAAGLSPVKMGRFVLLATFARLPALVISNFAGTKISQGNFGFAALIYLATFLFGMSVIYITKILKKKKGLKETVLD
ncbi:MAG: VTT domain-containing protein [Clostridia bacterium]